MTRPFRSRPRHVCLWPLPALILLLTLAPGCAIWNLPAQTAKTLGGPRQQRHDEVQRQFDEKRDAAEFAAASESFKRGNAKACEESLQRLLKRNPNHRDARLLLADLCTAENRLPEAFEHVKQALQAHPHDAQVQYAMGLLLDLANQRSEALAYYQRAAQWEPDNEVYSVGYQTALQATRPFGASTCQAQAAQQPTGRVAGAEDPDVAAGSGIADSAAADHVQTLLEKATAALKEGNGKAAVNYYREAAAANPDDPQILLAAAAAALRYNRPDLAVEVLRPAEKRFAGSAALKRALGAAYYRLGDYQSSRVALQQAIDLDKSSALAYFLMGCTLAKLDQSESAGANFRQAQLLDPRYTVRR